MPVWNTMPVNEQPELTLIRWRIIEVDDGRHFVGYCPENREGRVSNVIVEFDATTLRGRTKSGRVYQLKGRSGFDPDAAYVWEHWKRNYQVTEEKDVSCGILQEPV